MATSKLIVLWLQQYHVASHQKQAINIAVWVNFPCEVIQWFIFVFVRRNW